VSRDYTLYHVDVIGDAMYTLRHFRSRSAACFNAS